MRCAVVRGLPSERIAVQVRDESNTPIFEGKTKTCDVEPNWHLRCVQYQIHVSLAFELVENLACITSTL
jgi:hypothetical protein